MASIEAVRGRIEQALTGARADVVDTTGAGDHFEVRVVAPAFAGLGLVDQHRLVYEALGDLMGAIHALSLQTSAT